MELVAIFGRVEHASLDRPDLECAEVRRRDTMQTGERLNSRCETFGGRDLMSEATLMGWQQPDSCCCLHSLQMGCILGEFLPKGTLIGGFLDRRHYTQRNHVSVVVS